MILNRAKDYYENDKKILREQARDKYRNLHEEDKNKKREYGRKGYVLRKETKTKRISKKLPWDQKIKIKGLTFFLFIV